MTKHTAGPWETMEMPGPQSDIVCQAETGQRVCEFPYGLSDGEDAANARLIAAAPDLLEALERTLSWLASYPGEACMSEKGPYAQARAAIAKATGEST